MKVSTDLTKQERVNVLKENRVLVIETITTLTDKKHLSNIMSNLLSYMDNSNFYDVCDVNGELDVLELIGKLSKQYSTNLTDVETQNFFEEQRAKVMAFYNYNG